MDIVHLQQVISEAYREREQASRPEVRAAVEDTVALLRSSGADAAAVIRGLSDEQLDRSAPMAFAGGAEMSAVQLVEGILLAHPAQHLASIKDGSAS